MRKSTLALVAALLVAYVWMAAPEGGLFSAFRYKPSTDDGYNQLAEGMAQGHLYLPTAVDQSGPTPKPYLEDFSPYHGHYYLYFGVLPEVLLFLPWRLITHGGLALPAVVLLEIAAGYLLQLAILVQAKRRYFPQIGPWLEGFLALFLGCANLSAALLTHSLMYEVASAGAYACLSLAWLMIFQAIHEPQKRANRFAWASAAMGAAVACRPTSLFALPILGVAAVWFGRTLHGAPLRRLGLATLLPMGCIGVLLGAYNDARFGSALEFGFTHQLNPVVQNGSTLAAARFIPANLRWYYLTPPNFTPYFPYTLPLSTSDKPPGYAGIDEVQGQSPTLLLAVGAALAVLVLARRQRHLSPALAGFLALVLLGFAAVMLPDLTLGFRSNRYQADFQTSLILAAAVALGWTLVEARLPWRLLAGAGLCIAAVLPLLYPLVPGAYNHIDERQREGQRFLERLGNYPSHWAALLGFIHYGPRRLVVSFPQHSAAPLEALLSTGSTRGYERLTAQRGGENVRYSIEHQTSQPVSGAWTSITPGKPVRLELDMGSFYPPRHHPFFDGWSAENIEKVKTTARIVADGREVLRTRLPFYDSPPGNLVTGRAPDSDLPPFSGKILSFSREPLRDLALDTAFVESGLYRAWVTLGDWPGTTNPILSTGKRGAGDCLFLSLEAHRHVRFCLDCWGYGVQTSEPVAIAEGRHVLEVFAGPQAIATHPDFSGSLTPAQRKRLSSIVTVWIDGRLQWVVEPRGSLACFSTAGFGTNAQGFGEVGPSFTGGFDPDTFARPEADAFLHRNAEAVSVAP